MVWMLSNFSVGGRQSKWIGVADVEFDSTTQEINQLDAILNLLLYIKTEYGN